MPPLHLYFRLLLCGFLLFAPHAKASPFVFTLQLRYDTQGCQKILEAPSQPLTPPGPHSFELRPTQSATTTSQSLSYLPTGREPALDLALKTLLKPLLVTKTNSNTENWGVELPGYERYTFTHSKGDELFIRYEALVILDSNELGRYRSMRSAGEAESFQSEKFVEVDLMMDAHFIEGTWDDFAAGRAVQFSPTEDSLARFQALGQKLYTDLAEEWAEAFGGALRLKRPGDLKIQLKTEFGNEEILLFSGTREKLFYFSSPSQIIINLHAELGLKSKE